MNITRESLLNTFFAILILATFIFISSCQSSVTKEDVNNEMDQAIEAQEEAQQETVEALETAEQYHIDQKEADIKLLTDGIKDLDGQIKSLEKDGKKIENEAAQKNLASAIENLKSERDNYAVQLEEVRKDTLADYSMVIENLKTALSETKSKVKNIAAQYSEE